MCIFVLPRSIVLWLSLAAGQELATGDHAIGSHVFVTGVAATGKGWFEAEILAHRARYPPIQVKYVADLQGETSTLMLPSPLVAFVPLAQLRSDKPSPPQKRPRHR